MAATREQLIDALRLTVRPCPPLPGSWYACRGDREPTIGYTCHDDQCQHPEHDGRRPCPNPWHQLPVEVRDEVR